jgi:hypothetical protein
MRIEYEHAFTADDGEIYNKIKCPNCGNEITFSEDYKPSSIECNKGDYWGCGKRYKIIEPIETIEIEEMEDKE